VTAVCGFWRCRTRWGAVLGMVALPLLSATSPAQDPVNDLAFVPGIDAQPGGPTYDYRVGRFEVRNDSFATFLNDALANLGNERGQYL